MNLSLDFYILGELNMNKKKIFLVLSILWMVIIFYMSNQPASISSAQSGSFIELLKNTPIVGTILAVLLESDAAQFVIRKSAHMFSYCLLAVLWFMAIHDSEKSLIKTAITAFIITFIYACTDEIHQLFIQGRSGEVRDVFVDSTGAIIGIGLTYFTNNLKRCNTNKSA